jgi:hypothetical protein
MGSCAEVHAAHVLHAAQQTCLWRVRGHADVVDPQCRRGCLVMAALGRKLNLIPGEVLKFDLAGQMA